MTLILICFNDINNYIFITILIKLMKNGNFGIERINNRYSTPNNLRGHKLSTENMNRTMKLKLKKI